MTSPSQPHQDRVLTRAQLKTFLGIGLANATLLRLERKGQFPARFYLTEKSPVWRESAVLEFLSKREASAGAPNTTTEQATKGKLRRKLHPENSEATQ